MFRNAKNVGYYMIGQGSLSQLGDLLAARRKAVAGPAVFFLDKFFQGKDLADKLPVESRDMLLYVDTINEPTTDSVDGYTDQVPQPNAFWSLMSFILPLLLIGLFFWWILSSMQGGGNKVMQFGKSRATLASKETPQVTFADVAGSDEAVEELHEI